MKIIYFAIIVFFLFPSCGEDSKKNGVQISAEEKSTETGRSEFEFTVQINAVGNTMTDIAFEPSELTVPAGSRVVMTLNNNSSAQGMNHNIVIIKLGSGEEVATAAIQAGQDKEYVPDHHAVIAFSKMTNPGESIQFEFTAPPAGSYHYICTFPGHYPKMIGRLNVEEAVQ
jgi:azurin